MSLVAWHLHLIVLNDVLLDDGVAIAERGCLFNSEWVEPGLGDEAIVAGDVCGCLRRAHGQLVVLVHLHFRVSRQLVPWVVAVHADRHLELSLEVAALRRVGLAVVTPHGALRDSCVRRELRLVRLLRVCLPVLGGATQRGLSSL